MITVEEIVTHVGRDVLRTVTTGPGGPPVRDVTLYDVGASTTVRAGDLVLAVGVADHSETARRILREIAAADGAGLCLHASGADGDAEATTALAEELGVPLMRVPRGHSWDRLYPLLRTLVDSAAAVTRGGRQHAEQAEGDLFSLMSALAAVVRCPVVVDDRELRTLAYSSEVAADDLRRESILSRSIPPSWLERLNAEGVLRTLHRSEGIVRFPPWPGLSPAALHGRAGVAVRVGREVLGYIWVAEVHPLTPAAEEALLETARIAAIHIMRREVADEMDDWSRAEHGRALLCGGGRGLRELGIGQDWQAVVIALSGTGDPPGHAAALHREILPLVRLHFAQRHHTYPARLAHELFVVVAEPPTAGTPLTLLARFTRSLLDHVRDRDGVRMRAGMSSRGPVQDTARLRQEATRALAVRGPADAADVVLIDDVRDEAILGEVADHLNAHPHLTAGPLAALLAGAAADDVNVEALEAFLRARGNVATAARDLALPVNTVRYRLGVALKRSGLDPADPARRLVAELQLRAWRARTHHTPPAR
ncbi:PucR family transcriptional regulator [Streptomyces sp. AgN23]|uniref:helix-turn-helix domain-containing protein n=1 Tax=Streptomyces sp. AgN23 TaxID=1188315 RepID=UPI001B344C39|nr:PucR family transcriptional regulator [Streptomyces sp. AgN23]QTI87271.1 helix-turn-helix domain-containing protein [Streptomyces sp. AgN23]